MYTVAKEKKIPCMDGNGAPQSVNFVYAGEFFRAYTKLTPSGVFFL
jgi:hypothetical protein